MIAIISSEQLAAAFEKLPEDLKRAILDANVDKKIADIGQRNQLHVDKVGALMVETNLLMFGLGRSEDFVAHLEKNLNISNDLAKKIAGEINDEVFENIREGMKKIQGVGTTTTPPAMGLVASQKEDAPLNTQEEIELKEKIIDDLKHLKTEDAQKVEMDMMSADGSIKKVPVTRLEYDKDRTVKLKVILDDLERQSLLIEDRLIATQNEILDQNSLLRGYNESLQKAVAAGVSDEANQWREKIENAQMKVKEATSKVFDWQNQKNAVNAQLMAAAKMRIDLENKIRKYENADAEIAAVNKELLALRERARGVGVRHIETPTPSPVIPAVIKQTEKPKEQPPEKRPEPTKAPAIPPVQEPIPIPQQKTQPDVPVKIPISVVPQAEPVRVSVTEKIPEKPREVPIATQVAKIIPVTSAPSTPPSVPLVEQVVSALKPTDTTTPTSQPAKKLATEEIKKEAAPSDTEDEELSSEKLLEALQNLPWQVQDAVLDPSINKKIDAIATANNLSVEQTSHLIIETNMVLFQVSTEEGFSSRIEKRLKIPKDVAEKINKEMDAEVFFQIQKAIAEAARGADLEETEEEEEVLPPQQEEAVVQIPKAPPPPVKASQTIDPLAVSLTGIGRREQRVLETSGVEVVSQGEALSIPLPMNKNSTSINAKFETVPEALREIEDVPFAPAPSKEAMELIKEKLSGTFSIPRKETTYTLGTLGGSAPVKTPASPPREDPYREPIT